MITPLAFDLSSIRYVPAIPAIVFGVSSSLISSALLRGSREFLQVLLTVIVLT